MLRGDTCFTNPHIPANIFHTNSTIAFGSPGTPYRYEPYFPFHIPLARNQSVVFRYFRRIPYGRVRYPSRHQSPWGRKFDCSTANPKNAVLRINGSGPNGSTSKLPNWNRKPHSLKVKRKKKMLADPAWRRNLKRWKRKSNVWKKNKPNVGGRRIRIHRPRITPTACHISDARKPHVAGIPEVGADIDSGQNGYPSSCKRETQTKRRLGTALN